MNKKNIILRIPESWESTILGLETPGRSVQEKILGMLQAIAPELEPAKQGKFKAEELEQLEAERQQTLEWARQSSFDSFCSQVFTAEFKEGLS